MRPKRKAFPPFYQLLGFASIWALQKWLPIEGLPAPWLSPLGWLLFLLGLVMAAWSAGLFGKAKTGLIPFTESKAVVTSGPFKITRNPMYLGMTLMLSGAACWSNAASAWIPVVLFVLVIHFHFILPEERFMEEQQGEAYLAYKRKVRRWI